MPSNKSSALIAGALMLHVIESPTKLAKSLQVAEKELKNHKNHNHKETQSHLQKQFSAKPKHQDETPKVKYHSARYR